MKKLFALLLIAPLAMALNFSGFQSLNGIGTTRIFTVSDTGVYFVNGQLTLPTLVTTGGVEYSKVVATVDVNGVSIYSGVAGATGFQINNIAMNSGNYLTVTLSSTASADYITNAVRGQVSYGNTF